MAPICFCILMAAIHMIVWRYTGLTFFLFLAGLSAGMGTQMFIEYIHWRNFM